MPTYAIENLPVLHGMSAVEPIQPEIEKPSSTAAIIAGALSVAAIGAIAWGMSPSIGRLGALKKEHCRDCGDETGKNTENPDAYTGLCPECQALKKEFKDTNLVRHCESCHATLPTSKFPKKQRLCTECKHIEDEIRREVQTEWEKQNLFKTRHRIKKWTDYQEALKELDKARQSKNYKKEAEIKRLINDSKEMLVLERVIKEARLAASDLGVKSMVAHFVIKNGQLVENSIKIGRNVRDALGHKELDTEDWE